jgi:hypothetical protein
LFIVIAVQAAGAKDAGSRGLYLSCTADVLPILLFGTPLGGDFYALTADFIDLDCPVLAVFKKLLFLFIGDV